MIGVKIWGSEGKNPDRRRPTGFGDGAPIAAAIFPAFSKK